MVGEANCQLALDSSARKVFMMFCVFRILFRNYPGESKKKAQIQLTIGTFTTLVSSKHPDPQNIININISKCIIKYISSFEINCLHRHFT